MTRKQHVGEPDAETLSRADTGDEDPNDMPEDLTPWERRQQRLIRATVREVLREYGMNPDEMNAIQQDAAWTRRTRTAAESAGVKGFATLVGALVTMAAAIMLYAAKQYFDR